MTRLAFTDSTWQIWTVGVDGTNPTMLGGAPADGGIWQNVAARPQGDFLLVTEALGPNELWVIDAITGEQVRQLTNLNTDWVLGSGSASFSFSPDGSRFVCNADFAQGTETPGGGNVQIVNFDNSGFTIIGVPNLTTVIENEPPGPIWSPDGRRIAFPWQDPAGDNLPTVGVMNVDGSGQAEMITGAPETEFDAYAWYPDSATLLVLELTGGESGAQVLTRQNASSRTVLFSDPTQAQLEGLPMKLLDDGSVVFAGADIVGGGFDILRGGVVGLLFPPVNGYSATVFAVVNEVAPSSIAVGEASTGLIRVG